MKRILFILVFISAILACSSDTIVEGQVVDEKGEPIEEVMVQVMTSDIFVMTSNNGKFSIDTKGRGNELIFNKDGYQLLIKKTKNISRKVVLKR